MSEIKSKSTRIYRQKTRLNRFSNCLIEGDIVDINSIIIAFDNCYNIVPTTLEFYDGKYTLTYTDVMFVKIVDNIELNKTYDSNNIYLLYYNDDYVLNNYKNLIKNTQSTKDLVGKYIIDWKYNKDLIDNLDKSEFIELNYCIYN